MSGLKNRTAVMGAGMLFVGAGFSAAVTSMAYCEEASVAALPAVSATPVDEDELLPSLDDMTPEEQVQASNYSHRIFSYFITSSLLLYIH